VPFWSTKDPGQKPFAFQIGLGKVIKAWDEGVATMKVGEKAMIKVRTCTCTQRVRNVP
jgi:FKBP-type peptidyl-prolyl cis-trans isomerase